METRPQYYKNTLKPININQESLQHVLEELQAAVKNGTEVICESRSSIQPSQYGNIYGETPGIVLSLLRLERQKPSLAPICDALPSFRDLALERLISTSTDLDAMLPGRLGPLVSPLGPVVLRILAALECPNEKSPDNTSATVALDDIAALHEAVAISLKHGQAIDFKGHQMGGDEILYGRAGILWAILNIRNHIFDERTLSAMRPVFEKVPLLIHAIVEAGKKGSRDFIEVNGSKDAFPLMWLWMEQRYALGAVHGIAGILTVLLACEREELENGPEDYTPLIAGTITGLCRTCISHNGDLPVCIPPWPSSRSSHLVQICHGSPGLLLLLATARRDVRLTLKYWQPEWDKAIRLGTDKIWQEGLLSKGGNLCHGLTGNIWPFLMLHDCFEYDIVDMENVQRAFMERSGSTTPSSGDSDRPKLTGDYFLSRALAFTLLARESPPYSTALGINSSFDFRMPDRPYSLGEGLAGMLCAWAETCAVILGRLRKMEIEASASGEPANVSEDDDFHEYALQQLGFPGLGGNGPSGLL